MIRDLNDLDYIKRKTVEECCELSHALMQSINKPKLDNCKQIEDEIADLLMWLKQLTAYYNNDYIVNRIIEKKQIYFKDEKIKSDNI
jgi:NTP pyrophosphatase (non-canonical NTP hydrolase)